MAIVDTHAKPISGYQSLSVAIAFSKRIVQEVNTRNVGLMIPSSAGGVLANMVVKNVIQQK